MPTISSDAHARLQRQLKEMETARRPWWEYWRLLADFILPRRYVWLRTAAERSRQAQLNNNNIIDGTATLAARTLAAGMMNGITSPARPWFRLRAPGHRANPRVTRWLQAAQQDMLFAMSETNFYSALALQYLDLAVFQSSAMMIYEDNSDVFRCYNYALGEFYFATNNRGAIDRFAREFTWRAEQAVAEFGIENVRPSVREAFERGQYDYETTIYHLIEPNGEPYPDHGLPRSMPYREFYWEKGADAGVMLRVAGFYEWPGSCPRWEVTANDAYGTGPSSDALPDIRQLQHVSKRKLQSLDKMVNPPVVADIQLKQNPVALLPNGITFVAGANNVGVKPIYTVQPPVAEIAAEIADLRQRVREYYHNDLFRMISQLDTVRSATEIDARREEKLVLLGPVLDRFQGEALDPAIKRIFGIMLRGGYLPPLPPELQDSEAIIEYDSILSDARRALDAAPIERATAFTGNIAGIRPEVLEVVDWIETTRDYWTKLGVPEKNLRPPEEVAASLEQQKAAQAASTLAGTAPNIAQSAKLLSETKVGGAADALSLILGNQ